MPPALAVALEIYTWIGLGAAVLLGIAALIAWVADGSWVPVRAVVSPTPAGEVVRWFDDSGILGEAPLPHGASVHDEEVELCDALVSIPMGGEISSLNAGVAASVMLYEAWRQRSCQAA